MTEMTSRGPTALGMTADELLTFGDYIYTLAVTRMFSAMDAAEDSDENFRLRMDALELLDATMAVTRLAWSLRPWPWEGDKRHHG